MNAPVTSWMVSPVHSIARTARLEDAARRMRELGISALPVVEGEGDGQRAVGVLSRTDLLQAGRVIVHEGPLRRALTLPDAKVEEHMHADIESVGLDATIEDCARVMCKQRIHRVYVKSGDQVMGVVGTKEMMSAVIQARVRVPLREMLHGSLITVKAEEPLRLAIDRMAAAHHSGLVVLDGEWPVGVFSQAEALAARNAEPDERIDAWMSSSLLCLPLDIPVYRAAEQAHATGVRRVLGVEGNTVQGILSGLDFARIVKG